MDSAAEPALPDASTPDVGVPADAPTARVQLLGTPVRVMLEARERHESLLREFALLALSPDQPSAGTPRRLLELTELLGRQHARARERPDADLDDALAAGRPTVELVYEISATVLAGIEMLDRLLADADELCAQEQLLTLPRTALELRFAEWFFTQFREQLAGRPATAWDGPRSS